MTIARTRSSPLRRAPRRARAAPVTANGYGRLPAPKSAYSKPSAIVPLASAARRCQRLSPGRDDRRLGLPAAVVAAELGDGLAPRLRSPRRTGDSPRKSANALPASSTTASGKSSNWSPGDPLRQLLGHQTSVGDRVGAARCDSHVSEVHERLELAQVTLGEATFAARQAVEKCGVAREQRVPIGLGHLAGDADGLLTVVRPLGLLIGEVAGPQRAV